MSPDAVPAAIPRKTLCRGPAVRGSRRLPTGLESATGAERSADRGQSQVSKWRPWFRGPAGGLGVLLSGWVEVQREVPGKPESARAGPRLRHYICAAHPGALLEPSRHRGIPASERHSVLRRLRLHDHLDLRARHLQRSGQLDCCQSKSTVAFAVGLTFQLAFKLAFELARRPGDDLLGQRPRGGAAAGWAAHSAHATPRRDHGPALRPAGPGERHVRQARDLEVHVLARSGLRRPPPGASRHPPPGGGGETSTGALEQ